MARADADIDRLPYGTHRRRRGSRRATCCRQLRWRVGRGRRQCCSSALVGQPHRIPIRIRADPLGQAGAQRQGHQAARKVAVVGLRRKRGRLDVRLPDRAAAPARTIDGIAGGLSCSKRQLQHGSLARCLHQGAPPSWQQYPAQQPRARPLARQGQTGGRSTRAAPVCKQRHTLMCMQAQRPTRRSGRRQGQGKVARAGHAHSLPTG